MLIKIAGGESKVRKALPEREGVGPGDFPECDQDVEEVEEDDDFAGMILV